MGFILYQGGSKTSVSIKVSDKTAEILQHFYNDFNSLHIDWQYIFIDFYRGEIPTLICLRNIPYNVTLTEALV